MKMPRGGEFWRDTVNGKVYCIDRVLPEVVYCTDKEGGSHQFTVDDFTRRHENTE